MVKFELLKVEQLKKKLVKLNLSSLGVKAELQLRLCQVMEADGVDLDTFDYSYSEFKIFCAILFLTYTLNIHQKSLYQSFTCLFGTFVTFSKQTELEVRTCFGGFVFVCIIGHSFEVSINSSSR